MRRFIVMGGMLAAGVLSGVMKGILAIFGGWAGAAVAGALFSTRVSALSARRRIGP